MNNKESLNIGGKKYISSRRASEITGYTADYVGQLSRLGKVESLIIGRGRFVEEESLLGYKDTLDKATMAEAESFANSLELERNLSVEEKGQESESGEVSEKTTSDNDSSGEESQEDVEADIEQGPGTLAKNLPLAGALLAVILILFSYGGNSLSSSGRVLNKIGDDVASAWSSLRSDKVSNTVVSKDPSDSLRSTSLRNSLLDNIEALDARNRNIAQVSAPDVTPHLPAQTVEAQTSEEKVKAKRGAPLGNFAKYFIEGFAESGETLTAGLALIPQNASNELFGLSGEIVPQVNILGDKYINTLTVLGMHLGETSDKYVSGVFSFLDEYTEAIAVAGNSVGEKSDAYVENVFALLDTYENVIQGAGNALGGASDAYVALVHSSLFISPETPEENVKLVSEPKDTESFARSTLNAYIGYGESYLHDVDLLFTSYRDIVANAGLYLGNTSDWYVGGVHHALLSSTDTLVSIGEGVIVTAHAPGEVLYSIFDDSTSVLATAIFNSTQSTARGLELASERTSDEHLTSVFGSMTNSMAGIFSVWTNTIKQFFADAFNEAVELSTTVYENVKEVVVVDSTRTSIVDLTPSGSVVVVDDSDSSQEVVTTPEPSRPLYLSGSERIVERVIEYVTPPSELVDIDALEAELVSRLDLSNFITKDTFYRQTIVQYDSGSANVDWDDVDITGGTISGITTLSSGATTLNGALTGTTATFSSLVTANSFVGDGSGLTNVSGVGTSTLIADSDTDTKIQVEESSDEDIIRFDTAGTERLVILANGKVGLGTSAPTYKLQIHALDLEQSDLALTTDTNVGNGNVTQLTFGSDWDGTPNYATIGQLSDGSLRFSGDSSLSSPHMVITDAGLVGIGSSTPYANLSVVGDFALTGGLYDNNSTRGTAGQVLQSTGTGLNWVATSSLGISVDPGGADTQIQFNDGGSFGGDSGLTFNKATDQLSVGSVEVGTAILSNSNTDILIGNDVTNTKFRLLPFGSDIYFGNTANGALIFRNNEDSSPSEKMRISKDGNLGLGTADLSGARIHSRLAGFPQLRLEYDGSTYSDFQVSSAGDLVIGVDSTTNQFVLDNGGNVGIGTTSPASTLDVWGDLRVGTSSTPTLFAQSSTGSVGIGTTGFSDSIAGTDKFKIDAGTTEFGFADNGGQGFLSVSNGTIQGFGAHVNSSDGVVFGAFSNHKVTIRSGGNVNRLTIDTNGNVGIGSSTPYANLSVVGDFALTGGLYDNNSTLGTTGHVLKSTGTGLEWVATSTLGISGGSGTPGGSDTQVQFNDGGAFGGDSGLTFNKTTNTLSVSGLVKTGISSNAVSYATREDSLIFSRTDLPTTWLHKIRSSITNDPTNSTLNFDLATGESTQLTVLHLNADGEVGIGSTAPQSKLHLKGGDLRITSEDSSAVSYATRDDSIIFTRGDLETTFTSKISNSWDNPNLNNATMNFELPTGASTHATTLTLTAAGNVGIGTTVFGTSATKVLALGNATAPSTSIADGIQIYTEDVTASSELKVRDEAGNITTLSPHNFSLIEDGPSEPLAWSFYSERDGRKLNVDMLKAVRLIEGLSGERLVYGDLTAFEGEGVVHDFDLRLSDLEQVIGEVPEDKTLVDIILEKIASLGVKIFGGSIVVEKEICIEEVCVNKDQLKVLLQGSGFNSSGSGGGGGSIEQITEPVEEEEIIIEEEVAGTSTITDTTAESALTEPVAEEEPVEEPLEPIVEEAPEPVVEEEPASEPIPEPLPIGEPIVEETPTTKEKLPTS